MLCDVDALQAILFPAIAHPVGELAIPGRARDVGLGGEHPVCGRDARGVRQLNEASFEGALGVRAAFRETVEREALRADDAAAGRQATSDQQDSAEATSTREWLSQRGHRTVRSILSQDAFQSHTKTGCERVFDTGPSRTPAA